MKGGNLAPQLKAHKIRLCSGAEKLMMHVTIQVPAGADPVYFLPGTIPAPHRRV